MRHAFIAGMLALAGCATPQAGIKVQMQTADVPVAVACVKKADIPAEPALIGPLMPDARQAADLLGATDLRVRGWGHQLQALLTACSE